MINLYLKCNYDFTFRICSNEVPYNTLILNMTTYYVCASICDYHWNQCNDIMQKQERRLVLKNITSSGLSGSIMVRAQMEFSVKAIQVAVV